MFQKMLLPFLPILLLACNTNSANHSQQNAPKDTLPHYNTISENQKAYYQQQIKPLYNELLLNHQFVGGIVIAKNGEIVFEDYQGFHNYKTKEPNSENTVFHIASVSKTFTAMSILKLSEECKLQINDPVNKYLPSFPYPTITIKTLLDHRSGLPNYLHIMEETSTRIIRKKNKRGKWIEYTRTIKDGSAKKGFVTNQDILNFFAEKRPALESTPDKRFHYCNTNFALLALIVEKVSGIAFPQYVKDNIFTPLGMKNSFIFSAKDTPSYIPSYKNNYAPYNMEKFDCVYGDKNVYTTPRDLLLWDKGLFQAKYVSLESVKLACTAYSNEKPGTHNYGLGWRLFTYPEQTIPYHTGWWHGNNALFTRLIKDTATIIVLGNRYNHQVYKAKEIASVFNHHLSDSTITEE